jgi:periplasmic divalent cation tolerance protein
MTDKRVVLTTTGSHDEARKIARELVEQHLAACVNIVPRIESVFRWQGTVEKAEEFLLIIKTTEKASERVQVLIRGIHSYDLPECIVLPISQGSDAYLRWIEDSVK